MVRDGFAIAFVAFFALVASARGNTALAKDNLAWSFELSENSPILIAKKVPIFDLTDADVALVSESSGRLRMSTKQSASEAADEMILDLNVGGNSVLVSGTAHGRLAQATKSTYAVMYTVQKISAMVYKASLKFFDHRSKINHGVRKLLDEETNLDSVFASLGLFFATDVFLGGLYQSEYATEVKEGEMISEIEGEVQASYNAGVSASVTSSTTIKTRSSDERLSQSFHIECIGGDTTQWLSVSNGSQVAQIQKKWADSVSDSNLMIISGSFKPIWDLAANATRRQKLMDHAVNKWKLNNMSAVRSFKSLSSCDKHVPQLEGFECAFEHEECLRGLGTLYTSDRCRSRRCDSMGPEADMIKQCPKKLECYKVTGAEMSNALFSNTVDVGFGYQKLSLTNNASGFFVSDAIDCDAIDWECGSLIDGEVSEDHTIGNRVGPFFSEDRHYCLTWDKGRSAFINGDKLAILFGRGKTCSISIIIKALVITWLTAGQIQGAH